MSTLKKCLKYIRALIIKLPILETIKDRIKFYLFLKNFNIFLLIKVRNMDYIKIMELNSGKINDMMGMKKEKGEGMEYFKLKMKAMPRISFAATYSESLTQSDSVQGNNYTMVRYVDSGEVEILLQGRAQTH